MVHMCGTDAEDNIHYRAGKDGAWIQIRGKLKQVYVEQIAPTKEPTKE